MSLWESRKPTWFTTLNGSSRVKNSIQQHRFLDRRSRTRGKIQRSLTSNRSDAFDDLDFRRNLLITSNFHLVHQGIAMEHHLERVVDFSEDFEETGWSALPKQMLLGWTNFRVSFQISTDDGLSSPR